MRALDRDRKWVGIVLLMSGIGFGLTFPHGAVAQEPPPGKLPAAKKANQGENAKRIADIVKKFSASDIRARRMAIHAFAMQALRGEIPTEVRTAPEIQGALFAALRSSNKDLVSMTAWAMGYIAPKWIESEQGRTIIADWEKTLEDKKDMYKCRLAAAALGASKSGSSIPALLRCLSSPACTRTVEWEIGRALKNIDPEYYRRQESQALIPAFLKQLRGPRPVERAGAARVLGVLRARQAVDALVPLIKDNSSTVQLAAYSALIQIGDKRCIPAFIDLMVRSSSQTRMFRGSFSGLSANIADSLDKMEPGWRNRPETSPAAARLRRALARKGTAYQYGRIGYLTTLVLLANEKALPDVIAAASAPDPNLAKIAREILKFRFPDWQKNKTTGDQIQGVLKTLTAQSPDNQSWWAAMRIAVVAGERNAAPILLKRLPEALAQNTEIISALDALRPGWRSDKAVRAMAEHALTVLTNQAPGTPEWTGSLRLMVALRDKRAVPVLTNKVSGSAGGDVVKALHQIDPNWRTGSSGRGGLAQLLQKLRAGNRLERRQAAQTLEQMRTPESVDALIDALSDSFAPVADRAFRALEAIEQAQRRNGGASAKAWSWRTRPHATAVREKCMALLNDKDPTERRIACSVLGRTGGRNDVPKLIPMVGDEDGTVRATAASAIQALSRQRYAATMNAAVPEWFRQLRENKDPGARVGAAYALGYAPKNKAVADALIAALKDPDARVRGAAAFVLGRLKVTPAIPVLVQCLGDPSSEVVRQATRSLDFLDPDWRDNLQDKRGVADGLIQKLQNKDPKVRREAVRRLGTVRARESVPALIRALTHDSDAGVRHSILMELGRIDRHWRTSKPAHAAVTALLEQLPQAPRPRRRVIVDALGDLRDKRAVTPVLKLLRDHANYRDRNLMTAIGKAMRSLRGNAWLVEEPGRTYIAALLDQTKPGQRETMAAFSVLYALTNEYLPRKYEEWEKWWTQAQQDPNFLDPRRAMERRRDAMRQMRNRTQHRQ